MTSQLATFTTQELVDELSVRSESGVICCVPLAQRSENVMDLKYSWGNMHTVRGMMRYMDERLGRELEELEECDD